MEQDKVMVCPHCHREVEEYDLHFAHGWVCQPDQKDRGALKIIATVLIASSLCGCASFIKEMKSPPYPYAATHHTRAVGIEATVPNQAGDAVFKIRLGFFSDTTTLLPCSTNEIYTPAFSDRFKLGESGMDTTITEEINTGWKDQPPPPMLKKLISPKEHKNEPPPPNHSESFSRDQLNSGIDRPLTPRVGLFDSAAPVFSLQFSETERRPIAVLELTAGSAENIYSPISNPITYPDK